MAEGGVAAQAGYDVLKSLVTEWLWPRFKCHLDYWRCFRRNVQGLTDEIGLLGTERLDMDRRVEEARLRAEILRTTDVGNWKRDGDQKLADAAKILSGCDGIKSWKIISRYSWGKRAKKTADKISLLRSGAADIRISDPAPIPASAPIPHKPAMEFDSRRRIEEDLMNFLKVDRVCMVAICGAGGVGKTTMVRRIEDRVREEKLFDEVVHVVVSQQIDKLKIQKEIAELLGLGFGEDTLVARAHKLHTRLLDSKRKLIVFDDVWEYFELEDIGVPSGNKIVLTSRVTDACKKMGAQQIIQMEELTQEEAWDLFKEKAGSCVEDPDLLPIAKDVAEECKGLPVALVIVGKALQDKGIHVWKDSLSQLRRSMPLHIPDVMKLVYTPLKLSYDFLEDESLKSLFLLCCMFPEDYSIPIEHLTLHGIGLDMFEGIANIEEGRNRAYGFVEELKSRFLLLDGDEEHSVKMHDVVRDVAIYIASKEKNGFLKCLQVSSMDMSSKDLSSNCNWMSIDFRIEIDKICVGSNFPNLSLLMIRDSDSNDGNMVCFEGMKGLNMLSISNKKLHLVFPTLELLNKLRALHLNRCYVKDISVLGKLASLENLCIHYCRHIEVIPADIGRLKRLKLLELIRCRSLEKIAAGVISSLVRLEELKIIGCKSLKWEAKGSQSERRNAGLSELESLRFLACLEIDIFDHNLFAEEFRLSEQLVRFHLANSVSLFYDWEEYDRKISLNLPKEVTVGNWILQLVRSTQSLVSEGDGSNNLIVALTESLRNLVIDNCSTVKNLVNVMDSKLPEGSISFQKLNVSLGNLKSIYISACHNLCYLFSVATARSLVQLQSLRIENCDKMEQVFLRNEMELSDTDASSSIIEFPKLQELALHDLPNLASFSQGIEIIFPELKILELQNLQPLTTIFCGGTVEIIKFPKLEDMRIGNLPMLKSLLPLDLEGSHDQNCLHFFCNPKVEIHGLKILYVIDLQDSISKIWCRHVPINFFP